jgi:hypothetical protein
MVCPQHIIYLELSHFDFEINELNKHTGGEIK